MIDFLAGLAQDEDEDEREGSGGQVDVPLAPLPRATTSFLDLGCGNGSVLFELRNEDWNGRMMGVDYSAHSVALANQISAMHEEWWAANRNDDDDEDEADKTDGNTTTTNNKHNAHPPIEFHEWDVLAGPLSTPSTPGGWDVVLDKGTFDAISLSEDKDSLGRRHCEGYRDRLLQLMRPAGGLFLITSCNWTETELRGWFEGPELAVVGRIAFPSFQFGGVGGQTVSTLLFRRQ